VTRADRVVLPVPLTRYSDALGAEVSQALVGDRLPADEYEAHYRLVSIFLVAGYAFRHRHASTLARKLAQTIIRAVRRGDRQLAAQLRADLESEVEAVTEQARLARARASRARGTDREKRRFLDQAEKMRAKNPALTDQDIARRLQVEFGQRSERTYRRWLASGRPKR